MKKIFYEKVGKKYIPVSEYDSDWMNSFREGYHMVLCKPGHSSRKFNIDPNYAALIAAAYSTEDILAKALVKAGELRLQRNDRERVLTVDQKEAWDNLVKVFGDSAKQLEWPSAREVAEEGLKSLMDEALRLMQNPSAKKAFDEFLIVCELSK